MIFLFSKFLSAENEKIPLHANPNLPKLWHKREFDECDGINTIIVNKTCQCMPGFPFGDPNSTQGCYKCNDQCNKFAICAFPGRCVCKNGYIGDGVKECIVPVPRLDSSNTSYIFTRGGQNTTILTIPYKNFHPDKAYCKFDDQIVKAHTVTNTTIICSSPPIHEGIIKVFASYDNVTWTDENAFAECSYDGIKVSFSFISILIVIGIIIVLIYIYEKHIKPKKIKTPLPSILETNGMDVVPFSEK
ncbi:hypothetical protein TVAG_079620 [Trichomonas vaginalis G3]|uniref:IPT/TIG domain-containing protein n=1 Tax=Trichomonas vaginalis (strain ATCC PRA-98 / G3) TaxID=412133 RepID=A2EF92_TRIV3|nr:immunoglobulins domain-containing protein [Trichomonas vaginalis G3]EAY08702.1 hypothetical protein TVAG_079620 [Trichomonas vaginalis G3]KAI5492829.1 immunoglobulins domain-containing protein [Trichomonas vaginalis G3]|eukprot:XP_001320925.1 hypothetical protein [Trichomonas vaginalis G3]